MKLTIAIYVSKDGKNQFEQKIIISGTWDKIKEELSQLLQEQQNKGSKATLEKIEFEANDNIKDVSYETKVQTRMLMYQCFSNLILELDNNNKEMIELNEIIRKKVDELFSDIEKNDKERLKKLETILYQGKDLLHTKENDELLQKIWKEFDPRHQKDLIKIPGLEEESDKKKIEEIESEDPKKRNNIYTNGDNEDNAINEIKQFEEQLRLCIEKLEKSVENNLEKFDNLNQRVLDFFCYSLTKPVLIKPEKLYDTHGKLIHLSSEEEFEWEKVDLKKNVGNIKEIAPVYQEQMFNQANHSKKNVTVEMYGMFKAIYPNLYEKADLEKGILNRQLKMNEYQKDVYRLFVTFCAHKFIFCDDNNKEKYKNLLMTSFEYAKIVGIDQRESISQKQIVLARTAIELQQKKPEIKNIELPKVLKDYLNENWQKEDINAVMVIAQALFYDIEEVLRNDDKGDAVETAKFVEKDDLKRGSGAQIKQSRKNLEKMIDDKISNILKKPEYAILLGDTSRGTKIVSWICSSILDVGVGSIWLLIAKLLFNYKPKWFFNLDARAKIDKAIEIKKNEYLNSNKDKKETMIKLR